MKDKFGIAYPLTRQIDEYLRFLLGEIEEMTHPDNKE